MTFQIRRYPSAYRKRHKPGEMNKLESEYSAHLETLKKAGLIESYSFECETLKLGPDCRYTPDFRVVRLVQIDPYKNETAHPDVMWHEHRVEFHEVKGTRRKKGSTTTSPYCEDDALVKIKCAAELHPYKFILVWRDKDQWMTKEIN